ncbi:DDE-type integrase/transposase/recombinase [Deinococcus arenicola]|uniref:DDE-type integrase/transposase/recombinase n=1 Tax=Deinococcus arenicola TaxID=2994950 RepID=UPI003D663EE0
MKNAALGEHGVPEVIHADQLRSYGAAIREIPSLADINHQHVMSTARCNNVIEQEHRSTRRHERSQQGFKRKNEHKNSCACTPRSPISTIIPAPAFPPRPEETTKIKRSRRG